LKWSMPPLSRPRCFGFSLIALPPILPPSLFDSVPFSLSVPSLSLHTISSLSLCLSICLSVFVCHFPLSSFSLSLSLSLSHTHTHTAPISLHTLSPPSSLSVSSLSLHTHSLPSSLLPAISPHTHHAPPPHTPFESSNGASSFAVEFRVQGLVFGLGFRV
jgi:hypothetical protein